MDLLHGLLDALWPTFATVVVTLALIGLGTWLARRTQQGTEGLWYQLFIWLIGSLALVAVIILLPLSDDTQGQILSLLGVVLTAVIALSSTTFVANAMAGIMLHATRPFRPGDFVRVNDQFGRVTKRSLIHTQIQTEWRDITTIPNLLLVNNPVTVMYRDGTIISAEISIGYDQPYTRIQELLLQAASDAGLAEPFVLLQDLLDHAVVYRCCGFLSDMKHPLSARSNLRKKVLEQLHGHDVEIVSPSFMNQRQLDPGARILPPIPVLHDHDKPEQAHKVPEDLIFDKAEEAASVEELKQKQEENRQQLKREKAHLKAASDEERPAIERRISMLEQRETWMAQLVENKTGDD